MKPNPKLKLFLRRADESRPKIIERICRPVREVVAVADRKAFQGWRLDPAPKGSTSPVTKREGGTFILDFGEHVVGTFQFSMEPDGEVIDSPLHFKLTFGEVPAEVCDPLDPYNGALSRGWLQDELFNIIPRKNVVIERRLAFRYVKFEIGKTSFNYNVRFTDIQCRAVTSASPKRLLPYRGPKKFREIDAVALRTLANCMQDVFEDGPKRDRRLWLGDLRLQALANEVTYRNDAVVRRSLYLLAAYAPADNLIRSDAYVWPHMGRGGCDILDYALLFAPTVLEYLERSGDAKAVRELFPLAKFQIDFVLKRFVDKRGLFVDPKKYWLFIDWRDGLHKDSAIQGILVYSLVCLQKLAWKLGIKLPGAEATLEKLTAAARTLRDAKSGFYLSGKERQVSYATHAWLIIAGVISPLEGAELLRKLARKKDAVRPAGPYLWTYVVEAMLICGLRDEALALIEDYWGGMVKRGASTFWEVYDPENDKLSPYGSHLMNSYCHAWSCSPSYFLRKYFSR